MVFHWSLSDTKFLQVSKTLLSILADLNNADEWTVSIQLVTSKTSSPCAHLLVTVPRAPITIGIIDSFMFRNFFNSLARFRYLSLFSHSVNFTLWSAWTAMSIILQVLSFLLMIITSCRLAVIKRSVCISKSQRRLCVSFSRIDCVFLAHFPMDQLSHPVVLLLLLLLFWFGLGWFYAISNFVGYLMANPSLYI